MNVKIAKRSREAFLALAAGLVAAAAPAGSPMSYVPADAAAVGTVHIDQIKSSELAARLFREADELTVDGDAARFLADAKLDPKRDVDTVVLALVPQGDRMLPLAALEGRFDPRRLADAIEGRGGRPAGEPGAHYFVLPEKDGGRDDHNDGPGAVAVVDSRTVVAGGEAAVVRALAGAPGGGWGLAVDSPMGREARRVSAHAAAWVVVDAGRIREHRRFREDHGEGGAEGIASVLGRMSLMTFEATPAGDAVAVAATGYSSDEETRRDLADVLRGITAAWRMAAESKGPEALAMIRKFRVETSGEAVTVSGKLPIELLGRKGSPKER
jgi:hypothetical protein